MNIAIIGAGAAGLAAAKNLGTCHTITVFEALPSLAGVWASHASAPCQPIYEELRTNIPIDLMAFWDFPFDANDKLVINRRFSGSRGRSCVSGTLCRSL